MFKNLSNMGRYIEKIAARYTMEESPQEHKSRLLTKRYLLPAIAGLATAADIKASGRITPLMLGVDALALTGFIRSKDSTHSIEKGIRKAEQGYTYVKTPEGNYYVKRPKPKI